jgi:hypothetical protein
MCSGEKGFNCGTAIKANGVTPDDTPFKGSLGWQPSLPNTGLSEKGTGAPNGVAANQIIQQVTYPGLKSRQFFD